MFSFLNKTIKKRIELIGFWIILSVEISALFLFILGLPPFHFGYWFQVEPQTIGLHTIAAMCGIGLLIVGMGKPRLMRSSLTHPLVLLPCAIGLLSLAGMTLSPFPFTSLLGSPEMGQGAILFFDVAVLIAGGIVIRTSKKASRVMVISAGVSVIGMIVFLLPVFIKMGWFSFTCNDFLALPLITASVIFLTFWPVQRPRLLWILLCISIPLIFFSENQAALALLPVVGLLYKLLWRRWPQLISGRAFSTLMIVVMPVAVTAVINVAGSNDTFYSLASRREFHRLAANALSEQPHRIITGYGWGHLRELMIKYGTKGDRSIGGPGGKREWDAFKHNHPYTLNILLESFFALGPWGPLLILIWLGCVPFFCPKGLMPFTMPFMVSYAGIWAAWYHPPSLVPFLALAFAGNAGRKRPFRLNPTFFPAFLLLTVICIQAWGSWLVYRDSAACMAEKNLRSIDPSVTSNGHCPSPFGRYDRGGYLLADLLTSATSDVTFDIKRSRAVSPFHADLFKRRLCLVKNRLDDRPASLSLQTAFVLSLSALIFTPADSSWEPERSIYLPEWK
ncbi:MAG: hypothetical protein SV375_07780, partial [Thermodesulfobacteriota bacterium]|nr:hypothetical protein [Thermodesulfobacteriota bacterium]